MQQDPTFIKLQFKSAVDMIGWTIEKVVELADRQLAEFMYRQLVEKCRFLERKFDFKAPPPKAELPSYTPPKRVVKQGPMVLDQPPAKGDQMVRP